MNYINIPESMSLWCLEHDYLLYLIISKAISNWYNTSAQKVIW